MTEINIKSKGTFLFNTDLLGIEHRKQEKEDFRVLV
jgi:hypothetical protein